jgi:beta-lactamase superfamily II metal-dependent hydrolase
LGGETLEPWLEAHVLKVARHGDGRGSSAPFLEEAAGRWRARAVH